MKWEEYLTIGKDRSEVVLVEWMQTRQSGNNGETMHNKWATNRQWKQTEDTTDQVIFEETKNKQAKLWGIQWNKRGLGGGPRKRFTYKVIGAP